MDNEQLSHIFSLHILQTWASAYLAKSRGERQRIATQFGTSCICHVLTFAAYGKTGKQGEEIGYGAANCSYQHYHYHAHSTTFSIVST